MRTQDRIRALLHTQPNGMTIVQIGQQLGLDVTNVAKRLKGAYGCYVKRWDGQRQVWACVRVPKHAKAPYVHPKLRGKVVPEETPYKPQKTVWQEIKPWPVKTS